MYEPLLAGPHQLRSAIVKAYALVLLHIRAELTQAQAVKPGAGVDAGDGGRDDEGDELRQRQHDSGASLLQAISKRALQDASAFTRKQALMVRRDLGLCLALKHHIVIAIHHAERDCNNTYTMLSSCT